MTHNRENTQFSQRSFISGNRDAQIGGHISGHGVWWTSERPRNPSSACGNPGKSPTFMARIVSPERDAEVLILVPVSATLFGNRLSGSCSPLNSWPLQRGGASAFAELPSGRGKPPRPGSLFTPGVHLQCNLRAPAGLRAPMTRGPEPRWCPTAAWRGHSSQWLQWQGGQSHCLLARTQPQCGRPRAPRGRQSCPAGPGPYADAMLTRAYFSPRCAGCLSTTGREEGDWEFRNLTAI